MTLSTQLSGGKALNWSPLHTRQWADKRFIMIRPSALRTTERRTLECDGTSRAHSTTHGRSFQPEKAEQYCSAQSRPRQVRSRCGLYDDRNTSWAFGIHPSLVVRAAFSKGLRWNRRSSAPMVPGRRMPNQ